MSKRKEELQLHMKQKEWLFYASLLLLALFAFLFIGSREPVLFADSESYMKMEPREGLMPVYPFFLLINQCLFGMERYLKAVIVEQAVIAAVCVICFTKIFKDKFRLRIWEGYLVFFLTLMPFTTEMPQSMATQQILTEGLAYSFFYLFVIVLLKAVWTKKFRWFAGSLGMTVLLAMVRSQFQIMFCVCGVAFLYMVCRQERRKTKIAMPVRIAAGTAGCLIICFVGIFAISRITAVYKDAIGKGGIFYETVLKVQFPETYEEYILGQSEKPVQAGQELEEQSSLERRVTQVQTSQYVTLIFSRGMYEADREDVYLFDDEVVKNLYVELYEAADAEKQRYAYARKGLWMWQDIVGGIGKVGTTCFHIPAAYYTENYPEIVLSDDYSETRNAHLTLIGITLLKAHFGRFLYHTLMLLPQAFICTVFFQIKPIYLLCHLVTLFLYLSALILMIWGFADKKANDKCAEFMVLVLGSNVVMVVVISMVFFGQQRYLVYNFGAFYIAYYLLLREFWNCHIYSRVKERFAIKKGQNSKLI